MTPRGDLAPDEKATIELFERLRDSVVFISTKQAVVDFWPTDLNGNFAAVLIKKPAKGIRPK